MENRADAAELGPFQFTILCLTLLALGALILEYTYDFPPEADRLLRIIDDVICVFLLVDFLLRFRRAESKARFLRWGWIELLASIPEISAFRWGRVFRVLRILRLYLVFVSLRSLIAQLFRSRAHGGIAAVFTMLFYVLSLASVGILVCEQVPDANIRTAADAVWWSVTTITTVGYGDHYPVTVAGRILAMGLMFVGVGLFGVISGLIASLFMEAPRAEAATAPVLAELKALREEVQSLRRPDCD